MVHTDRRRGLNRIFYDNQNRLRVLGSAFGVTSLVVAWFGHEIAWDTLDHYTDTPVKEFLALWLGAIYIGATVGGLYGISRFFNDRMDSAESSGKDLDRKERRGGKR